MDTEVLAFLRKKIKNYKSRTNLNDLIVLTGIEFGVDLDPSDCTFIKQHYRSILTELWAYEVIENIENVLKAGKVNDDVIIEILGIFQSLKAFENTPKYLQGVFHNAIQREFEIFTSKDFLKSRREICDVLSYKIMNFSKNSRNEYKLFTNLIEVLRNSNKLFESVVLKLKLNEFAEGNLSLFQVSHYIQRFDFPIDKYNALKEATLRIENNKSIIQHVLQKKIGNYLKKLISKETKIAGKKVWLLQRKVMTSDDLNINFNSNIEEIHIACDILHINQDLPQKYREKNVFVLANTICVHQQVLWDLSGYSGQQKPQNAGQYSNGDGKNGEDGEPGSSGGNCEIFSAEINNASFWTIKSNGGNGSHGQDGGDGRNGDCGCDITEDDFTLNRKKLTKHNFVNLLNDCDISTSVGSRRFNIYENHQQKQFIFNRDENKSELLVLIKGSSGKLGGLGGFGGYGDNGGHAGKINIHSNDSGITTISINGRDGLDGRHGINGRKGRNGHDECMKISSIESYPIYGKFPKRQNLHITQSTNESKFSIFYQPFGRSFYISSSQRIDEQNLSVRNTPDQHEFVLNKNEEQFFELFKSVIRNANLKLKNFIRDTHSEEFLNKKLNFKQFASILGSCDYDIIDFDSLKIYADLYSIRSSNLESPVRSFIHEYTADAKVINKSGSRYEIKKKLLTTEDLNTITQDFSELFIICDVLHVNSSLSDKFRGKNMSINANTVKIHKSVTWNLSGYRNFLETKDSGKKYFENGGHCIINCTNIINSSIFKIISNGGDASQAKNGIDAEIKDIKINGKNIVDLPTSMKQSYIDEGLVKYLVKNSNSNYILLVKGSSATPAYNGIGEKGGIAGKIDIKLKDNLNMQEIEIVRKNGNDDISHDGRDIVIYVKNGRTQYLGRNEYNKYDLMMSSYVNHENSVLYSSKYYYPKLSRSLKELRRPCCNGQVLYESVLWTLRNSNEKFQDVVTHFKLASGCMTLGDIAESINSNSYKISFLDSNYEDQQFYADLKVNARNFKQSKHEKIIREKIKDLVKDADVKESFNILTIKKKFCHSSYLMTLSIGSNITEIRLICDTLFIDSELSKKFQGVSFAINANYVHIINNFKWILSGEKVYGGFSSRAGQENDGTGEDGEDGNAGKSGGNFSLHCKIIDNSSALTIESNGSDGTDGQDGGNGDDGEDGKDAKKSSFIRNGVEFAEYSSGRERAKVCNAFNLTCDNCFALDYSNVETDDGLSATAYIDHNFFRRDGFILVRGSSGTPGKTGGLGGYGGQGGYAGEIEVKSTESDEKVIKFRKQGENGKLGEAGLDGLHGNEGRDAWKYDENGWSNPNYYGLHQRYKYKLTFYSTKKKDSIKTFSGNYVKPESEREAKTYSKRNQNTSKHTRERNYQSVAKKSSTIRMNSIISEHSSYLNSSELNLQHKTSTQSSSREIEFNSFKHSSESTKSSNESYFHVGTHKASNKCALRTPNKTTVNKNSDILAELTATEHSDYIKSTTNEIDEIMDKYKNVKMEIEEEEMQVQTEISVQMKFEGIRKKISKFALKSDKVSLKNVQEMLMSGYDAATLFKALQKSNFSYTEHKNLLAYINRYKIEQNQRENQNNEIDKNLKKYFKRLLRDPLNSDVIQIKTLKDNRTEWIKFFENPKVMTTILRCLSTNYLLFQKYYFKKLSKGKFVEARDVTKLIHEKIVLNLFGDIYLNIIQQEVNICPKKLQNSSHEKEFLEKIAFLDDTDDFLSDSEQLNRHFRSCSREEKNQVVTFFLLNMSNFNMNLSKSIIELLMRYRDDIKDIKDELDNYANEIQKLEDDAINSNDFSECLTSSKADPLLEVFKKMYKDKK